MSSSSESPPTGEEDPPFSGFDEIENAFNRVSIAADSLLDSIRDDSLRGKQKKERRQHNNKSVYDYYTDSDDNISCDDDMDDDALVENNKSHKNNTPSTSSTPRSALSPYQELTGYEASTPHYQDDDDDDGEEEESLDGSLMSDMHNLRSSTKALQEDLLKSGQVFEANVTTANDNGKTFFQKLEAAADAQTPKMRNLNLDTTSSMNKRTPVKAIDTRRNTNTSPSVLKTPKTTPGKLLVNQQQPAQAQQQKPPEPSFLEQLRQFCNNLLGKRPNVPLFLVNIVVWALVFRMAFVAKDYLMDSEGQLSLSPWEMVLAPAN